MRFFFIWMEVTWNFIFVKMFRKFYISGLMTIHRMVKSEKVRINIFTLLLRNWPGNVNIFLSNQTKSTSLPFKEKSFRNICIISTNLCPWRKLHFTGSNKTSRMRYVWDRGPFDKEPLFQHFISPWNLHVIYLKKIENEFLFLCQVFSIASLEKYEKFIHFTMQG